MINRLDFFRGGNSDKRRDNLHAWLLKQHLNDNEIIEAVVQQRDIQLVKRCAKKAGFKLRGFVTNNKLELYFDVYKRRKSICYISKGWNDPGFRIGDCIEIDKTMACFKERFYDIFRICSKELISVGILKQRGKYIPISIEIGIYKDGFNENVFKRATTTIYNALKAINLTIGD